MPLMYVMMFSGPILPWLGSMLFALKKGTRPTPHNKLFIFLVAIHLLLLISTFSLLSQNGIHICHGFNDLGPLLCIATFLLGLSITITALDSKSMRITFYSLLAIILLALAYRQDTYDDNLTCLKRVDHKFFCITVGTCYQSTSNSEYLSSLLGDVHPSKNWHDWSGDEGFGMLGLSSWSTGGHGGANERHVAYLEFLEREGLDHAEAVKLAQDLISDNVQVRQQVRKIIENRFWPKFYELDKKSGK